MGKHAPISKSGAIGGPRCGDPAFEPLDLSLPLARYQDTLRQGQPNRRAGGRPGDGAAAFGLDSALGRLARRLDKMHI